MGPEACGCRPKEPDGKPQGPVLARQVNPRSIALPATNLKKVRPLYARRCRSSFCDLRPSSGTGEGLLGNSSDPSNLETRAGPDP